MLEKPSRNNLLQFVDYTNAGDPGGIEVRGDQFKINFHQWEILLVRIYYLTKANYKSQPSVPFYIKQKHLYDQEYVLMMLRIRFGFDEERSSEVKGKDLEEKVNIELANAENDDPIELGPLLISNEFGSRDFVANLSVKNHLYAVGLSDLISVSSLNELALILDFQYFNQVKKQKVKPSLFFHSLQFHVSFLLNKLPGDHAKKQKVLIDWILRQLESDHILKEAFYDYVPQSYSNITEQLSSPKIPFLCDDKILIRYFNLLTKENPINNRPFASNEEVEFLLYQFFKIGNGTYTDNVTLDLNINLHQLKFFIYNLRGRILNASTNLVKYEPLFQAFKELLPNLVTGDPSNYGSNIQKGINDQTELTDVLEVKSDPSLARLLKKLQQRN